MAYIHQVQVTLAPMLNPHIQFPFLSDRFFQRMAMFTLYFSICLFGLLVRGYYHLPETCLERKELDKSENTYKSMISQKDECRCHYTNFLRRKSLLMNENETIANISSGVDGDTHGSDRRIFEPMALVSERFTSEQKGRHSLTRLGAEHFRWFECTGCNSLSRVNYPGIFVSELSTRRFYLRQRPVSRLVSVLLFLNHRHVTSSIRLCSHG